MAEMISWCVCVCVGKSIEIALKLKTFHYVHTMCVAQVFSIVCVHVVVVFQFLATVTLSPTSTRFAVIQHMYIISMLLPAVVCCVTHSIYCHY